MNRRAFILGALAAIPAQAEELGTPGFWQNQKIRQCCSEADAVYADDWRYEGGELRVTVTGGGPRDHAWAPIGKTFVVPPDRIVTQPTSPDGHAMLFLVPSTFYVRCFVMGAGT